jgi:hypothetical protein
MGEVVPFRSGGGGDGPDNPMLEQRVASLEEKIGRMDAKLSAIELVLADIRGQLSQMPRAMDFASLRAEVAEVKGRIGNLPTTWTLLSFAVGACLASAGLAFTIARVIHP